MNPDPNHYREYICNIEAPKLKARELRLTRGFEINGDVELHDSNLTTTGVVTCNDLSVSRDAYVGQNLDVDGNSTIQGTFTPGNLIMEGNLLINEKGDITTPGTVSSGAVSTLAMESDLLHVTGPSTLNGQVTVTGTPTTFNSDLTIFVPSTLVNQSWYATATRLYCRPPGQGVGRAYLETVCSPAVPPNGEVIFNTVVEGYSNKFPISLRIQNSEVTRIEDALTTVKTPWKVNVSGTDVVSISSTQATIEKLQLTRPLVGYSDWQKGATSFAEVGMSTREGCNNSVFPVDGTWVEMKRRTVTSCGVYMITGQIRVMCTPLNTATVNKFGLRLIAAYGGAITLVQDTTNFGKQISDNTWFTLNITGVHRVSANTDTFIMEASITHTGTSTNVYNNGNIDITNMVVTRIA